MGYLTINEKARWPRAGIPYRIHQDLAKNSVALATLNAAISQWNTESSLKLVNDPNAKQTNYIRFELGLVNAGGKSFGVGMQGGGQVVSMDYSWNAAKIALIHEIGHAAGFEHEHQRRDRNSYIEVLPPAPAKKGDIEIKPGQPVGRYDCRSLMHYLDDDPYVGPRPGGCSVLSNTAGLSHGDRLTLNYLTGSRFAILKSGKWGANWSHFAPYESNRQQFFVAYSSHTGIVHFASVLDGGGGTAILKPGKWDTGWTSLQTFEIGGGRFLMVYDRKSGAVRMDMIAPGGAGSSNVWEGTWNADWSHVVAIGLTSAARDHVLVYDQTTGTARLDRVNPGGKGTQNVWETTLPSGATSIMPYRINERDWHVLLYAQPTGKANFVKLVANGGLPIKEQFWAKIWTHFMPYPLHNQIFDDYHRFIAYGMFSGDVHFDRMTATGLKIEVMSKWDSGWTALMPMFLGHVGWGNVGMIAYRAGTGLVHLDALL